ncbi:MAG: VIT and VWA domain-containing protein, partial [bacterium]|nr:VIT and VWA domain-containing protein [bacterium]
MKNPLRIKRYGFSLFILLCLAVQSLKADGLIVIPRPNPIISTPYPLQVRNHNVKVSIKDLSAETSIDQVFHNPSGARLEGYYLFPVPKGSVLKKFSMYVNGQEVQAELLDAKKARDIYEDIVRKQRDPALLEYNDYDVFKARIFPIEPHEDKRVKISYRQILEKDNDTIEYTYPLNTEKFSSTPLQEVSVHVEIESGGEIKNVYCPSHKTEIIHKTPKKVIVSYEDRNTKPDKDFKIYFQGDNKSRIGVSLLTYKKEGEKGFFFLNASPGLSLKNEEINEKDITFVLDTSGSMAGEKLEQAKKALLFCINNLNKGDQFEIIRFSTETEPLFSKLAPADTESLLKAKEFVKNLKAIGGTAIEDALKQALTMKEKDSRPYMIIFITDGKPTIGETNEDEIVKIVNKANTRMTRIFTFGIGDEINTHLLDKITEFSKAYRTYISPEEDIEI